MSGDMSVFMMFSHMYQHMCLSSKQTDKHTHTMDTPLV